MKTSPSVFPSSSARIVWSVPIRQAVAQLRAEGVAPMEAVARAVQAEISARRVSRSASVCPARGTTRPSPGL